MKSITLFYRNLAENADKVYQAEIVPSAGGFEVVCRYGKRGAKLSYVTKTRQPVPLDEAQKIFTGLIREKTAKGYTDDAGGIPFNGDTVKLGEILPHPRKTLVTLAEAREWSTSQFLIQRKLDGSLARREVAGAVSLGELVTARSGAFLTPADRALIAKHGSFFAAFTVESVHGEKMLTKSTRERWGILCSFAPYFPADVVLVESATVPDMLTGEEGYVAHKWSDGWGEMLCHKAEDIFTCRVTATGGTQAAQICDAATGQARGACKFGGGAIDRVRIGSVVRIAGMGLTDAGKIRQPTLCREWLVKF